MGDVYVSADYTTLGAVKRYIEIATTLTTDDALLIELIREASDTITDQCNRSFVPSTDVRTFSVPRSGLVLELPSDLLTITTITEATVALVLTTDYTPMPLTAPYVALRRVSDVWEWNDTIVLTGLWGWNNAPSQMWRSLATLNAAINDSVTTITPAVATAVDVLSYIKVDSEVMQVTAVATGNTSYTVTRGELGTTAASHLISAAVTRYQQYEPINRAAALRAAHLYRIRANPGGERIEGTQGAFTISPKEPQIVADTVRKLRRMVQEGQAS